MTVEANLNGFIRRDLVTDGPVLIRIGASADGYDVPWTTVPPVVIHDARPGQKGRTEFDAFTERGFVLLPHISAVQDWDSGGATPYDRNEIVRLYMPEIEALIRQRLLPGQRVEIEQSPYIVRRGPGANGYALGIHNDFGRTPDDYQESLEAFSTPEYAASWRSRFDRPEVVGFMVINFWRTVYMDTPLRHMPLGLCEPASVAPDDIVPAALVGFAPSGKKTNQLSLRHNPAQRWWYYPDMTHDEVLAFKIFEFSKDAPHDGLKAVFHTAFADPGTPPDAPERQSCEHRVGVYILRDA